MPKWKIVEWDGEYKLDYTKHLSIWQGYVHKAELEVLAKTHNADCEAYEARIAELERRLEAVVASVADGYAWCPICGTWVPHETDDEYAVTNCLRCGEPDGDMRAADALRAIAEGREP